MTTATLAPIAPVRGVPDGKGNPDPNVREAWLAQRRGGVTATEIRDCHLGQKRREIIAEKVTPKSEDLSHIPAVNHGNIREPILAEWTREKYGIEPCDSVYAHGENSRFLASPDGITIDPFTGELIYGTADAVLAEIKTSKHDLHPGRVTDDLTPTLIQVKHGSHFDRANYYTQMQWQMFVMNAARTLFVWEQRTDEIDPATGTFGLLREPRAVWVNRDQKLIDHLVADVAPKLLAEIDAALAATDAGIPPVAPGMDEETARLVSELLAARQAEAIAAERKKVAWEALQARYLAADAPDVKIPVEGFATLAVSTSTTMKKQVDEEAMRRRAPKVVEKYEELRERFTKQVPTTSRRLTVTEPRGPKAE